MNCSTAYIIYIKFYTVLNGFKQLKRKIRSDSLLFLATKVRLYQSFSFSSEDVRLFFVVLPIQAVDFVAQDVKIYFSPE